MARKQNKSVAMIENTFVAQKKWKDTIAELSIQDKAIVFQAMFEIGFSADPVAEARKLNLPYGVAKAVINVIAQDMKMSKDAYLFKCNRISEGKRENKPAPQLDQFQETKPLVDPSEITNKKLIEFNKIIEENYPYWANINGINDNKFSKLVVAYGGYDKLLEHTQRLCSNTDFRHYDTLWDLLFAMSGNIKR